MQSTIKSKNELTVLFFIHSGGSQKFATQHLMLLLGCGFQSQFFANQFGVFERWRLQFQLLHDFVDMSFVDGPKFGQNIAFCCFGHLCCLVFTRNNCLTLFGFTLCVLLRWEMTVFNGCSIKNDAIFGASLCRLVQITRLDENTPTPNHSHLRNGSTASPATCFSTSMLWWWYF